jgi:hypothetical protein
MTTDNGFQPDRPPIFLTERLDETGHADIEKRWDIATVSSRILKASALAAAVTTIGVGVLSVGNPVALVANMADWWSDKPALQLEADTSTMQTTADIQDAPAAAGEPAREEVAVAAEPTPAAQRLAEPVQVQPVQVPAEPPRLAEVAPSQTESGPPVSAELFRQFQAWAAEDESRKRVAAPPAAPTRVAQETQQPRPAKKHRRVHSVQNARAEVRPQRHYRTRVREEQDVREPIAPVVDPRTVDPAAQPPQPPSFLQSLGFR